MEEVLGNPTPSNDLRTPERFARPVELLAPHRKNRTAKPTHDGRKMRRYRRRWKVERTFAWLHSYRRTVTRFEKSIQRFDGFVSLACAFIALNKMLRNRF